MPVYLLVCAVAASLTLAVVGSPSGLPIGPSARQNITAQPPYMNACAEQGGTSRACISASVAAIDNARQAEPMLTPDLVLPSNYRSLSPARQAFVVIDLERVDRGLRPLAGMVARLNHAAARGARAGADPDPSYRALRHLHVRAYRTVFARDYGVLAADYEWMYDDGYSPGAGDTTNASCPWPGASGCWAHRASILDRFLGMPILIAGMGEAPGPGGTDSVTGILAGTRAYPHHFTYTWRDALSHGADGYRSSEQ
ncbi:MAG TPA: hypothetical protein VHC43_01975 [Mycobacteriales bacterium]|nr:hypothetical protein [Mycobacteriales bacterium]